MRRLVMHLGYLLVGLLACPVLWAQGPLRDPTRPAFGAASVSPSSLTQEARPVADANPGPAGHVEVLVLGKGKNLAVVDGVTVRVGDTLHDWQVVSLSERGIALRRDDQTQNISSTPGVVKTLRPRAVATYPLETTPRRNP